MVGRRYRVVRKKCKRKREKVNVAANVGGCGTVGTKEGGGVGGGATLPFPSRVHRGFCWVISLFGTREND